jgi:hypothetical protein
MSCQNNVLFNLGLLQIQRDFKRSMDQLILNGKQLPYAFDENDLDLMVDYEFFRELFINATEKYDLITNGDSNQKVALERIFQNASIIIKRDDGETESLTPAGIFDDADDFLNRYCEVGSEPQVNFTITVNAEVDENGEPVQVEYNEDTPIVKISAVSRLSEEFFKDNLIRNKFTEKITRELLETVFVGTEDEPELVQETVVRKGYKINNINFRVKRYLFSKKSDVYTDMIDEDGTINVTPEKLKSWALSTNPEERKKLDRYFDAVIALKSNDVVAAYAPYLMKTVSGEYKLIHTNNIRTSYSEAETLQNVMDELPDLFLRLIVSTPKYKKDLKGNWYKSDEYLNPGLEFNSIMSLVKTHIDSENPNLSYTNSDDYGTSLLRILQGKSRISKALSASQLETLKSIYERFFSPTSSLNKKMQGKSLHAAIMAGFDTIPLNYLEMKEFKGVYIVDQDNINPINTVNSVKKGTLKRIVSTIAAQMIRLKTSYKGNEVPFGEGSPQRTHFVRQTEGMITHIPSDIFVFSSPGTADYDITDINNVVTLRNDKLVADENFRRFFLMLTSYNLSDDLINNLGKDPVKVGNYLKRILNASIQFAMNPEASGAVTSSGEPNYAYFDALTSLRTVFSDLADASDKLNLSMGTNSRRSADGSTYPRFGLANRIGDVMAYVNRFVKKRGPESKINSSHFAKNNFFVRAQEAIKAVVVLASSFPSEGKPISNSQLSVNDRIARNVNAYLDNVVENFDGDKSGIYHLFQQSDKSQQHAIVVKGEFYYGRDYYNFHKAIYEGDGMMNSDALKYLYKTHSDYYKSYVKQRVDEFKKVLAQLGMESSVGEITDMDTLNLFLQEVNTKLKSVRMQDVMIAASNAGVSLAKDIHYKGKEFGLKPALKEMFRIALLNETDGMKTLMRMVDHTMDKQSVAYLDNDKTLLSIRSRELYDKILEDQNIDKEIKKQLLDRYDERYQIIDSEGRAFYKMKDSNGIINPVYRKFYYEWLLLSQNMLHLYQGNVFQYKGGNEVKYEKDNEGLEFPVLSDENKAAVDSFKRNVDLGATGHRIISHERGLGKSTNYAIVEDTKTYIESIGGQNVNQSDRDGACYILPMVAVKQHFSLGGTLAYGDVGTNFKMLNGVLNPDTGVKTLFKYAEFTITNERLRLSQDAEQENPDVDLILLVEKMLGKKKMLNGKTIKVPDSQKSQYVYRLNHLTQQVERSQLKEEYEDYLSLWNDLGAQYSMKQVNYKTPYRYGGKYYNFTELLDDDDSSTRFNLIETDKSNKEVAHRYIEKTVLGGGVKTGQINNNITETLFRGNTDELAHSSFSNDDLIIQLNKKHETDNSEQLWFTQIGTAVTFNGKNPEEVLAIYNEFTKLTENALPELAELAKYKKEINDLIDFARGDDESRKKIIGAVENYFKKLLSMSIDTDAFSVAPSLLARDAASIPFDNEQLRNKLTSILNAAITRASIKHKFTGGGCVVSPDDYTVYEILVDNALVRTDKMTVRKLLAARDENGKSLYTVTDLNEVPITTDQVKDLKGRRLRKPTLYYFNNDFSRKYEERDFKDLSGITDAMKMSEKTPQEAERKKEALQKARDVLQVMLDLLSNGYDACAVRAHAIKSNIDITDPDYLKAIMAYHKLHSKTQITMERGEVVLPFFNAKSFGIPPHTQPAEITKNTFYKQFTEDLNAQYSLLRDFYKEQNIEFEKREATDAIVERYLEARFIGELLKGKKEFPKEITNGFLDELISIQTDRHQDAINDGNIKKSQDIETIIKNLTYLKINGEARQELFDRLNIEENFKDLRDFQTEELITLAEIKAEAKYDSFRKQLLAIAARTPGQSYQSVMGCEAVGFLWSEFNTIMQPKESLFFKGEDMDIDVANVIVPTVDNHGRYVEDENDTRGSLNKIIENLDIAVNNPSNRLFSETPADLGELADYRGKPTYVNGKEIFADEYISSMSPISVDSQTTENMSGKKIIGIVASSGMKAEGTIQTAAQIGLSDPKELPYVMTGVRNKVSDITTEKNGEDKKLHRKTTVGFEINGKYYEILPSTDFGAEAFDENKFEALKIWQNTLNKVQKEKEEKVFKAAKERYKGNKVDAELSSNLTAATDHAKELLLGVIACNDQTAGMFTVMISNGVPLDEAIDFMKNYALKVYDMSASGDFSSLYPKTSFSAMAKLAGQAWEDSEKAARDKDYYKNKMELALSSIISSGLSDYFGGEDYLKTLKSRTGLFSDDVMMINKTHEDLIKAYRGYYKKIFEEKKRKNAESFGNFDFNQDLDDSMFENLFDSFDYDELNVYGLDVEDDFTLSFGSPDSVIKFINRLKWSTSVFAADPDVDFNKYKSLQNLIKYAEERTVLSGVLGINQGLKATDYDEYSYITRFEKYIRNVYAAENLSEIDEANIQEARTEAVKLLTKPGKNGEKAFREAMVEFNFERFVTEEADDENQTGYVWDVIKSYDLLKQTVNVPYVLYRNKMYLSQIQAMYKKRKAQEMVSYKSKFLKTRADQIIDYLNSLHNENYDTIRADESFIKRLNRFHDELAIDDFLNSNLGLNKSFEYETSPKVKETVTDNLSRLDFINWFNDSFWNQLNSKFAGNSFVDACIFDDGARDSITKELYGIVVLPEITNELTQGKENKLHKIKEDFNKIKNLKLGNNTIGDILFLYNLITYKNSMQKGSYVKFMGDYSSDLTEKWFDFQAMLGRMSKAELEENHLLGTGVNPETFRVMFLQRTGYSKLTREPDGSYTMEESFKSVNKGSKTKFKMRVPSVAIGFTTYPDKSRGIGGIVDMGFEDETAKLSRERNERKIKENQKSSNSNETVNDSNGLTNSLMEDNEKSYEEAFDSLFNSPGLKTAYSKDWNSYDKEFKKVFITAVLIRLLSFKNTAGTPYINNINDVVNAIKGDDNGPLLISSFFTSFKEAMEENNEEVQKEFLSKLETQMQKDGMEALKLRGEYPQNTKSTQSDEDHPFSKSLPTDKKTDEATLRLIADKITKLNPDVKINFVTDETGEYKQNAWVKNGEIFINTDRATIEDPVHELIHLAMPIVKLSEDWELIKQTMKTHPEFNEIRRYYPELNDDDITEELFVRTVAAVNVDPEITHLWNKKNESFISKMKSKIISIFKSLLGIKKKVSDDEVWYAPIKDVIEFYGSNALKAPLKELQRLRKEQTDNYKTLMNSGLIVKTC